MGEWSILYASFLLQGISVSWRATIYIIASGIPNATQSRSRFRGDGFLRPFSIWDMDVCEMSQITARSFCCIPLFFLTVFIAYPMSIELHPVVTLNDKKIMKKKRWCGEL